MVGRWFKHGKWPKILVNLHYYSMISFALLLVTGLALYLPIVHAPLIPYIPYIYQFHILLGIIFGITLITPLLRLLPVGKHVWRLDWWFPIVFGSGIVLTGLVLWQVTWFPSAWRSSGFTWHGDLSYILGGWLIVHAFVKAVGWRPDPRGLAGQVEPERRRFVRYLGIGSLAAVILTVIDPFTTLSRWWRSAGAGSKGAAGDTASARFAAFYTVTGGYPTVSLQHYTLQVGGQVANPTTLDWRAIQALPVTHERVDFQCVTGWSVPNVGWSGVHMQHLVALVKPQADAKFVHFYSFDGQYSESLSLAEALDPTVLLAYALDGAPLPTTQGAPLRLIVPKMYGYKSIKWVNRVEFATTPLQGFWEQRGYPNEAVIGSFHGLL